MRVVKMVAWGEGFAEDSISHCPNRWSGSRDKWSVCQSPYVSVALSARDAERLSALASDIGALGIAADASDSVQVARLFTEVESKLGALDILLYNASSRVRGPLGSIDPVQAERSIAVTAVGAFHRLQEAAGRMAREGKGAILLTGATAGVKGFAWSCPHKTGHAQV